MINEKLLQEIIRRLVNVYNPLKIYLFGSYAWGSPTQDSDIDLLIVVEHSDEKNYKRSIPGSLSLYDLMIAKDILVYTKEEFERRSQNISSLMYKIKEEGKAIYARV